MNELRNTIQHITEELNDLMRDLSATDDSHARELVEQVLTTELILDFKASVDAMRHLIWLYIEALSRVQGKEPLTVMNGLRLQSATNMLRALHSESVPGHLSGSPLSFVEHVQTMVENYRPGGEDVPSTLSE
jgi:hypothetical protein